MRENTLLITVCLALFFPFLFQHTVSAQTPEKRSATPVICPAKLQDMHTRVNLPKSNDFQRRMQNAATAEFQITFGPGAEANPDAKAAFQFALDIWSTQIVSPVPIKIFVDFADLGAGVLASAGPTYNVINFPNAPEPDVLYPAALANALAGEVLFPDEDYDLVVNLGNGIPWYFGTDGNTPSGLYDFVTVALHEAAHGLGFTTTRNYTGGVGSLRSNGNPSVFGLFMVDGDGTPLLDLEDPSTELGDAFTSGDLFMNGTNAKLALNGDRPELYAPSNFQGGSSLAHWDETAFPAGNTNSLMTPQVGSAESNFDIGDITRGLFKDMGWVINDTDAPPLIASPSSIEEEVSVGNSIIKTISLSNISEDTATISIAATVNSSTIETISPNELTIPATEIKTFDVTINTTGLTKGIYNDTLSVTIQDNDAKLDIPLKIRVLDGTEKPIISVSPEAYNERIEQFKIVTRDLVIQNSGDDNLRYSININDTNSPSFTSRVKTSNKTIQSQGFSNLQFSNTAFRNNEASLVRSDSNSYNKIVTSLYATDFEDFNLSEINGQQGWASQYENNWIISDANAFDGTLHFRGVSDGLGSTRAGNILAISPTVTPADDPFMVASAKINIQGEGVTWEFIPQSPSENSVNTRIRFNPDKTIDVLVDGDGFTRIGATTPTGYFNIRVVVDKADSTFSIYFDAEKVFSGQGFAPTIEQVVFLSNMEVEGATMDVDNLEITDGDSEAFFLSASPITGIIPFGSSTTVKVKFDTRILEPGQYNATITINSNDQDNASIAVPVALKVLTPPTIGVTPDSLSTAVNVQTDIPPIKTASFTVSNTGESPLEFSASLGATNFTPPSTNNRKVLASLDMKQYGEGNVGSFKEKLAGASKEKIQSTKRQIEKANITITDSLYYDSGIAFPDDFAGLQNAAYTTAIKFDVEANFTLTAIRNGYRTETVSNPTVILEIYKGGDNPTQGELLATQTFTQASEEGILAIEELDEALSFSAGESFWVIHKYPDGIAFPQGIDANATQRPNTYFFSSDGGASYNPSGFVFFIRALSGDSGSDDYITLEPSSGIVNPGENLEVSVTFNGENQPNGTYNRAIKLSSNDPVTPNAEVATTFEVSGQVSKIKVSDELLLFNNTFLGTKKELTFTISNEGLAPLNVSSITSDNPDFTINTPSEIIQAGSSLDVVTTFTPTSLGSINGIITIESDAPNANPIEVIVNGVGVDPPIAVLDPVEAFETTNAGTTVDSQITLKNNGNSPLTFSFPDLAVAAAFAKPDVKLNDTKRIDFKEFRINQEKGYKDTRVGSPVLYNIGTDNEFGYKWIDSDETGGPVYNFNDIATTGTNITELVDSDDTTEVAISFPFEFYGNEYNKLFINANGFVTFQEPATTVTYSNTQIPTADNINNMIAALWDDLEPKNFNGAVHYQDFEDYFVVQWTQVSAFLGSEEETVTFQIVLYKDGNIDIFYEDVDTATFRDKVTVGIENADGSDGAQVAFNTAYLKDKLAIRFIKPAQPLTNFISNVTPLSGVVAAGRSKDLAVTLDATSLNDGVYYDKLSVSSNDPVNKPTTLFELTVIGFPEIAVTPDSLQFDPIFVGLSSQASILVQNKGTKKLNITAISNQNRDFVLDITEPFSLQPGTSQIVRVDFTPTTIGTIEDVITITSNDTFGNETLRIPLSGVGVDPPVIEITPESFEFTLVKGDLARDSLAIKNTGGSTLTYTLSPPYFVKAGERNATKTQYPKLKYAKIESKEAIDTRVGPKFLNASGGPGTFGYTWIDNNSGGPAYNYIDISSNGEKVATGADGNVSVALPFAFPFFGEAQDSITISANGYVTFASITGIDFINRQIPNEGNPNLLIAGLWDDLEPQNGGGVFYLATDDYFIVQYEEVPGFSFSNTPPAPVSFQIILYPNGTIKTQYKNVDSTIKTNSTVGLEGPLGLSGLQVIFNAAYLKNELAITFSPPVIGSIQPGENTNVPIEISTENLESEERYTGDIIISSNDPVKTELKVPVTIEVLKGPEVINFTLIDVFANEEVGLLQDGDSIDLDNYQVNKFSLVANKGTTNVGSVVFDFNGKKGFKTENIAPFSLNGDYKGTRFKPVKFLLGTNTVTATPYTGKNGTGIAGEPFTISFEVFRTTTTEVVSFTLIDVNTQKKVGILNNNDIINLKDFEGNKFSVVANVGPAQVKSVVFDLNGTRNFNTDNSKPFSLNGDRKRRNKKRKYNPVQFRVGTNTITATPYSKKKGKGEAGTALTISFEVIEDDLPSIVAESKDSDSKIRVYPNPVYDYAELTVQSKSPILYGYLHDMSGLLVNKMDFVNKNGFIKQQIDMTSFKKGIYILSIINNEGTIISKLKMIKK